MGPFLQLMSLQTLRALVPLGSGLLFADVGRREVTDPEKPGLRCAMINLARELRLERISRWLTLMSDVVADDDTWTRNGIGATTGQHTHTRITKHHHTQHNRPDAVPLSFSLLAGLDPTTSPTIWRNILERERV